MSDTPIQRFLSALQSVTGQAAIPRGDGWQACCPAHEDNRPSLSIDEGHDGRVLVLCRAKCDTASVCESLGLKLSDLMPVDALTVDRTSKNQWKKGIVSTVSASTPKKLFPSANAAIQELERTNGKRSGLWTYQDAVGDPVGVVLRWDKPDGKTIRPVSKNGQGWFICGMSDPRPLYNLPDVIKANRVYVVEGEKAADAGRSLGLVTTTSPHGSQSPGKTDWSPLAGKEAIILPDHDVPGEAYANQVIDLLTKLNPVPVIKVVRLSGLETKGDVADFVDSKRKEGWTDSDLFEELTRLADETEPVEVSTEASPPTTIEKYQRFPIELFPEPIRGFVSAGSKAIGCDPSFLALPMLSALGAAIGNTRRLVIKRGWSAPPIVWAVSVGESGTAKTPALSLVLRSVRRLQMRALEQHQAKMETYQASLAHYEKTLAEWKRDKKTISDPPVKPTAPTAERFLVSDTTIEALAPLLLSNPRGLLLARDELAGWIGSFDQYKGKGGADAAHWLSMYNGESMVVDRKSVNPPTIYVPTASVCVTGGIQPAILNRVMGSEYRESGLLARILLSCPPREPKRWTDADIDPRLEQSLDLIFETLYSLEPTQDGDGEDSPVFVGMDADSKAIYKSYFAEHNQEQVDLSGDLAAAWSKLEEIPARLALVFHFAKWASDPSNTPSKTVDAETMQAAVALTQWFKRETKRVYGMLGESEESRERRQLAELIHRKGGRITVRTLMRTSRNWKTATEAEQALSDLVKAGFGCWENQPSTNRGGQPTREFVLTDAPTVDTTPLNPVVNEVVSTVGSVDTVDTTDSDVVWI